VTHPERALYGGAWLLPVLFVWAFVDPPPWCEGRVALATGYGLGVLGGALLTAAGFLAARGATHAGPGGR
jgi:hypothetical protein